MAHWEGPLPAQAARIASEHRGGFTVLTVDGEQLAQAPRSLRRTLEARGEDKPVVGDWVVCEASGGAVTLRAVLPRRTRLRRKRPQSERAQILVANVDVVFIVTSAAHDLSVRRIERYLTVVRDGGAEPVLVVTKADLVPDAAAAESLVLRAAPGTRVVWSSVVSGVGISELRSIAKDGTTVAMLGSSGVGKSTLANELAGHELLAVGAIRGDGKGRHTTVRRELVRLPSGGALIDTPGMRELGLFEAERGVEETFADVESLAAECRFADCQHQAEPGCAILAALALGTLEADRYGGYAKLKGELVAPPRPGHEERAVGRVAARALRARLRDKGRR